MKAMIFAAGLGTRLRPITDLTPKALVQVAGKPMLQRTIEHLRLYGFNDLIVNVHHHAAQVMDFLQTFNPAEIKISVSDESDQLLDTGGGLKKASWFFNDNQPFLVINADIISDLDLRTLLDYHNHHKALATLVVRERHSSRSFLFDDDFSLCGWENKNTSQKILTKNCDEPRGFPFSGIHVLDPRIFTFMEESGKFSIVDIYMKMSSQQNIKGFLDDRSVWFDIGDNQKLRQAEAWFTR